MVLFISLVVNLPLSAYTIVDAGESSPVTGVVLDEKEVADYFSLTHKKEELTKQVDILNTKLYYMNMDRKRLKSYYQTIGIVTFGGITVGITTTLLVIYILGR